MTLDFSQGQNATTSGQAAVSGAAQGASAGAVAGPWGAVIGAVIGGVAGAAFGRGKTTGFGKALDRSLDANTRSLQRGAENFRNVFPDFISSFRQHSPVFGALEARALGDLNDTQRTARLENAFQTRLAQQQSTRGTFRSPSAALQSSFAGLQFQEQIRQQSFQNAMGFQTQLGQPLATGFFQAGLPNIQGDIGFQQHALEVGQAQARNQSIANGLSQGFNAGLNFPTGGNSGQQVTNANGSITLPSGGTLTMG